MSVKKVAVKGHFTIDDYAKMADKRMSDLYVVFTIIFCGAKLCLLRYKAHTHILASNRVSESV